MPLLTQGKTNWKYILILLILVVIVGGGILGYLKYFEREIESLTKFLEIKKPEKLIKDETANWKTYRNEEYGFEIKYPPNFIPYFLKNSIYFVEEKCEWGKMHCPYIGIDFIKTPLTLREWGIEYNKNPGVSGIGEPLPPGKLFEKIGEYEVFQFYTAGVSGVDDNTLFQLPGTDLVNIHRHTSEAGEIPKSIYERMLSTFTIKKPEIYSILDELGPFDKVFEYKIGNALFKIFQGEIGIGTMSAYFEAYNKGQLIYTSETTHSIDYLLSFRYEDNIYIIISDYSGGAYCCTTAYIFILDKENNLKFIKKLDLFNLSIGKEDLVVKNEKLYLRVSDPRFIFYYTYHAASYYFQKFYLIEGDKLIMRNSDFKEEYINEALRCEETLITLLERLEKREFEGTSPFKELSPYLVCITTNYILADEEERAWQKLHEIYNSYKLDKMPYENPPGFVSEEEFTKGIKEKMVKIEN